MIKVLAFPKDRFSGNPHISNFYSQIELGGQVTVEDLTYLNWIFQRCDIFHFHWPEFFIVESKIKCFLRVSSFLVMLSYFKLAGTKIVWSVHNLKPHEQNNYYPLVYDFLLKILSKVISGQTFFSEHAQELFIREYPFFDGVRAAVVPHALYTNYGNGDQKAILALRKQFLGEVDGKILFCFGAISKYRDYEALIDAFRHVSSPCSLVIAGPASDEQFLKKIRQKATKDSRIHLLPFFVEDLDVANYFGASDLVVQPFKNILNSGSVMLALSLGKPVLVPRMGSIKTLQKKVGSNVVCTYDFLTGEAIENALIVKKAPANNALKEFSLKQVSSKYEDFYKLLLEAI